MNWFEKILYVLSGTMETPRSYGWFHLLFVGLALTLTLFLCLRVSRPSEKTVRSILLGSWAALVLLELYKQLIFSVSFDPVRWDYQWYAFPFQFCSAPLYVLPLAALARRERMRDAARTFLASYSLFAGLAVFVYPNDVFISTVGVNIQTMVHHGAQLVLGFWLGVCLLRQGKLQRRELVDAATLFAVLACIALALNLAAPLFTDETFNMYYIGPRFPCTLVILSELYALLPYPLFLALYVCGFSLLAAGIWYCFRRFQSVTA